MATSRWARNRQFMYAGGIVLFCLVLSTPFIISALHEPADCFDGKQNQDETAIDRGGSCQLVDERTLQPHAILWSRTFPVRDGFYNSVAYIENPNQSAGVYEATYQFKLYDERNILIAERNGRTPIFPGKVFPIFESRIDTGNRIPARTFFTFTSDFQWERMEDPTVGLSFSDERLNSVDTVPRLDAVVRNNTVLPREDVVFVATLFDITGNALASSRTIVDRIEPDEEVTIAFTWPRPFLSRVGRVDIVPLALPGRNK